MRELLQRHPLIAGLAALAVLLLVVLGIEAAMGVRLRESLMPTAPVKAAAVDARLLPPVPDAPAEQLYPETGSRPLFTPTRRPAPAAEAVGALVKGQFVLHGVTIVGETRIAMLREKTGAKIYRVEKGREVLNGVTVADVEPDKVTLRLGGDSEVVALVVQRPPGAPGATSPTAAAPGPFPGAPRAAAAVAGAVGPGAAQPVTRLPTPIPGAPPGAPVLPRAAIQAPLPTPPAGTTPPGAATTAPSAEMTPEELLARRRARRAQQSQ